MEILTIIFYILLVTWYVGAIALIIYLYKNNYAPYKTKLTEPYFKELPSDLKPGELSLLMYRKIEPQVFTTVMLELIKKGALKLNFRDNDYHFKIVEVKGTVPLARSESVVIEFLKNVKEDDTFTLTNFANYCGTKKGDSEFLFQYDLWKNILRRELIEKQFFEEKKGYTTVKVMRNFGILLLIANIVGGYHLIAGYFTLLPILFLPFFFQITYRRTEQYSEEYEKWCAFSKYLQHLQEFPVPEDLNRYTVSAIILKQMDALYQYQTTDKSIAFANELNKTVLTCYRHAYLNGNRSVTSLWGFK